jgi:hypothetical protein
MPASTPMRWRRRCTRVVQPAGADWFHTDR